MTGYVVTVDFKLMPGAMDEFRRLIEENASTSCRDEKGCRRFDVLAPKGEADRILLYEIYDDRASFEAHLGTGHFARFNRESAALVIDKRVQEFDFLREGSAAP